MLILANGCSWTDGGGLRPHWKTDDERKNLSWPAHLGRLFNSESINLGIGCGSNDRILRTTYDWIFNTNKEKLKETVAVIQWAEPSRYEFYRPTVFQNKLENKPERWVRCTVNHAVGPIIPTAERKLQDNIVNLYLSNWTDIQAAYKFLFHVEALSSIFNSFGIKYFYWSYINYAEICPDHILERLKIYPWLDHFPQEYWDYERVSEDDQHPNLHGNVQIAEIIFNKLKDKI